MFKICLPISCLLTVVFGGYLHTPIVQPLPAASSVYPLSLLGTNLASSYVRFRNGPRREASRLTAPVYVQPSYVSPHVYPVQPSLQVQPSLLRPIQYIATPVTYSYSSSRPSVDSSDYDRYRRSENTPDVLVQVPLVPDENGIPNNGVVKPESGDAQPTEPNQASNGQQQDSGMTNGEEYPVEEDAMGVQNEGDQDNYGQKPEDEQSSIGGQNGNGYYSVNQAENGYPPNGQVGNGYPNNGQGGNGYPTNGQGGNGYPTMGQNGNGNPSNEQVGNGYPARPMGQNGYPSNGQVGNGYPTMGQNGNGQYGNDNPSNGQVGNGYPSIGQNGNIYPSNGKSGNNFPANGQNSNGPMENDQNVPQIQQGQNEQQRNGFHIKGHKMNRPNDRNGQSEYVHWPATPTDQKHKKYIFVPIELIHSDRKW